MLFTYVPRPESLTVFKTCRDKNSPKLENLFSLLRRVAWKYLTLACFYTGTKSVVCKLETPNIKFQNELYSLHWRCCCRNFKNLIWNFNLKKLSGRKDHRCCSLTLYTRSRNNDATNVSLHQNRKVSGSLKYFCDKSPIYHFVNFI